MGYSRSHGQQGGGEPEGFPKVGLSLLIFVLSLLAKTIIFRLTSQLVGLLMNWLAAWSTNCLIHCRIDVGFPQTPMNVDRLIQIETDLRAPALNLRKAALDELARCPAELAVPLLRRLSQEKDFGLRRLAVMGLGNHRTDASLQALRQVLHHEQDGNVLAEAANSLFEFGDAAIPLLHTIFEKTQDWLVRQTVISLLVETEQYEVLLAVVTLALADTTQTVKEAGILALGTLLQSPETRSRALDLLMRLAADEDWRVRWRAAIALQHCRLPEARQLIAQLQRDSHFRVVAAALDVATYWTTLD
jgi:HEAT repeat protein